MKTFHNQVRELKKMGYSEQELSLLMDIPRGRIRYLSALSLRRDNFKTLMQREKFKAKGWQDSLIAAKLGMSEKSLGRHCNGAQRWAKKKKTMDERYFLNIWNI